MDEEIAGVVYNPTKLDWRKGVLTVEEAAERIFVSPRTLRRMMARRSIRHYRIGSLVRLYQPDLDAFLSESVVEALPRHG